MVPLPLKRPPLTALEGLGTPAVGFDVAVRGVWLIADNFAEGKFKPSGFKVVKVASVFLAVANCIKIIQQNMVICKLRK